MTVMPQLGVGTFRLEGNTAIKSVLDALEIGFRHIDTAQAYNNEEQVGDAIKTSGLERESLFLTTKVWMENLGKDKFIPSVHESLAKLKTDYVDLLLIHWPSADENVRMEEYLQCLAQAKEEGLTRHIGVSNFTISQIEKAQAILGKDEILTNQIELHPFMQNRQVVKTCKERGIGITAYMPFAVGKVMDDDTLNEIAGRYNATPAQVVLAWMEVNDIQTIPSSTNKDHLQSNYNYGKVNLSADDLALIDNLDNGERIVNPDFAPDWD
ncbi:2,5-didehydrogluconate reductase DkgB [Alteromonas pelagimontana]|uniref:2,5-didehydrogluconate reductase DkgB n=1 Tax=Alteromonas pelagimontana TaxID=1858656 RepID=A0A6M4M9B5_9ALTE|nr:2,5-didehydrogluconate reductase DkgB [Alteromonas pelagimontana]QJR79752.1 2,5-didehydrogluconate reductase DkgB [Alteromonas pelagimontana]